MWIAVIELAVIATLACVVWLAIGVKNIKRESGKDTFGQD